MSGPEAKLEAKCCAYALSKGVRNSKLGQNGDPDRQFWGPVRFGFLNPWLVEFKRPGGVVSKLQETKIRWLSNAGYSVDVIDSFEEFVSKLEARL